jgi:hypothetical protein
MKKCWIALLFFSITTTAQTTLHVATKTLEKSFDSKKIKGVNLQGERADIEVNTWSKDEVKVSIEFVAKHPDRLTAGNELAYLNHVADQSGSVVYLRNFVVLPKGVGRPTANLKTIFRVMVPANCAVTVQNQFGKTTLKGLTNTLELKTAFSAVSLENMKGIVILTTQFGELNVENLDGNLKITTDRTDVQLTQLRGECRVRAEYGTIVVNTDRTLVKLNINANKTAVKYAPDVAKH